MKPFKESSDKRVKPIKVKEWAIERLKGGHSPKRITIDIQKLYGIKVTLMTVYRWRNQHKETTGETILPWFEFNKTTEQKRKNKGTYKSNS